MIIPLPHEWEDAEIIEESVQMTAQDWHRIEVYLLVKPWLCPDCGLTNFGHNKRCADFKCRRLKP